MVIYVIYELVVVVFVNNSEVLYLDFCGSLIVLMTQTLRQKTFLVFFFYREKLKVGNLHRKSYMYVVMHSKTVRDKNINLSVLLLSLSL